MDKVVDFLKFSKESKFGSPLSKEKIIELILSFSEEGIFSYIDSCEILINNVSNVSKILSSRHYNIKLNELVDGLDENQLNNLSTIVMYLKHSEEVDDYTNLINATAGLNTSTEMSAQLSEELVNILNRIDKDDLNSNAQWLIKYSFQLQNLGKLFFEFKNIAEQETWQSKLEKFSDADLKVFISTTETLLDYQKKEI